MLKLKQVRDAMGLTADSIGRKKNGNFMVRREYFYRNGMTGELFRDRVQAVIKSTGLPALIVDHGDHWAPFRGGASTANSSHFWVELAASGE